MLFFFLHTEPSLPCSFAKAQSESHLEEGERICHFDQHKIMQESISIPPSLSIITVYLLICNKRWSMETKGCWLKNPLLVDTENLPSTLLKSFTRGPPNLPLALLANSKAFLAAIWVHSHVKPSDWKTQKSHSFHLSLPAL